MLSMALSTISDFFQLSLITVYFIYSVYFSGTVNINHSSYKYVRISQKASFHVKSLARYKIGNLGNSTKNN